MEPDDVICVYFVNFPPKAAARVNDFHYRDPLCGVNFVWWRSRWCAVTDQAMELFEGLDVWLQDPSHGLLWGYGDWAEEMCA